MFTVKKFLCCIKLKQGCKFIGWFGVLYSLILSLVFIGLLIFDLYDVVDYINDNFPIRKTNDLPIACKKKMISEISWKSEKPSEKFPFMKINFRLIYVIKSYLLNVRCRRRMFPIEFIHLINVTGSDKKCKSLWKTLNLTSASWDILSKEKKYLVPFSILFRDILSISRFHALCAIHFGQWWIKFIFYMTSDILLIIPFLQKHHKMMKVSWVVKCLSIFSIYNKIFFQQFLVVTAIFIFLLFFEAIRSRRLEYFIIGVIDCYFWICVYSLSQIYKINYKLNRQFDAIRMDFELKFWFVSSHFSR